MGRVLVRAGHQVTVIALATAGEPATSDDAGIRVHRVRPGNLHWYIYRMPGIGDLISLFVRELEYSSALYRQALSLHRLYAFDLIEGTETGAFWVAHRLKEVPLVIRLHGEHYTLHKYTPDLTLTAGIRLSRLLQRMSMRRARLLISPSRAHAREVSTELGSNCPPVEIIPNCVESPRILRYDAEGRDDATVLFAGRLEQCKAVPVLLAAAGHVLRECSSARFVLAGAPHPTLASGEIDALIRHHALDGHIELIGHVPREQLDWWYRRATICVLPSYYETFGISALEAMANGVPVVATSVGGLPEVVQHGVVGLLVAPGNAPALAEAILRLLKDPETRRQMGLAGLTRSRTDFDALGTTEKTVNAYGRILGR
ncbi:MAG: glycosyltransferase family 1 protein [Chloroflexota bacterium]|nr:MAG: glycosyltransferase family 1 protein [Chloroflexota bacterium]